MKYCVKCGHELKEGADICLYCGNFVNGKQDKNSPKIKWWQILLIILVIAVVLGLVFGENNENFSSSDSQLDNENTTGITETQKNEDLTLLDGHRGYVDSDYVYKVTGIIQNNSDRDYSYVSIEFYVYDVDGVMLDTCFVNNSGLEANGKWKFEAMCWLIDGNAKDVASYKLKDINKW